MVLPRPSSLRGFAPTRLLRSGFRTANRSQWQNVARRGYAEGGHGHAEPSSDLPWLISGIAVTIPSCWFLWPSSGHGDEHGAHGGHAEHDDEEEHEEGGEDKEEEAQEAPEEESKDDAPAEDAPADDDSKDGDDKPAEESDDSKEDTEKSSESDPSKEGQNNSGATTEGKNMPASKGNVEGVQFKGKTNKGDADNEMPDTRKREPDSKGAFKKRIDSGYAKDLGADSDKEGEGEKRDEAKQSKPVSENSGDMSNKQKGLSNTATRHSSDIGKDPEKSKKPEGGPDTAKAMGTVDPNRPAS